MAKSLKVLLAVAGTLLMLLVTTLVAALLLFDANDYKSRIAQAVQQKTGRSFTVGNIELSVFPRLELELHQVTLGNAEGFGAEPMLSAERVQLGARLLPLLRERRVETTAIGIERATLRLAVDAAGRNNWQDLVKPGDPAAAATEPPLAERLQKLDIGNIRLDALSLSYDDAQAQRHYRLDELALDIGRLHAGKPFPVEGRLKARSAMPEASATVEFSSEVTLAANGDVQLGEPRLEFAAGLAGDAALALQATLEGESLRYIAAERKLGTAPMTLVAEKLSYGAAGTPAIVGKGSLRTTLDYALDRGDARLGGLELKADLQQAGAEPLAAVFELKSAALSYAGAAKTLTAQPLALQLDKLLIGAADKPALTAKGRIDTALAADLGKQQHGFEALTADLQLGGSRLPQGRPQALKLRSGIAADLSAHRLRLDDVKLSAFGLDIAGSRWFVAGLDRPQPSLEGDLRIAPFDPRALMTAFAIAVPQTADAKVLKSASLTTQLAATANSASFRDLTLKLDDTTLRGTLIVRDLANQSLRFDLDADRLDADRYLPPASKPGASVGAEATPAAKTQANRTELPIDLVDRLNAEGRLEVASMKLKNLKLAKVRLTLDDARGGTHRQRLAASLYGGSADLDLAMAPGARHALKLVLNGIDAGPLLRDFIASDKLSGKGSMTLDVSSSGRTLGAFKQGMDGKLTFRVVDGAVKGFNLGKVLRDGQALLARQLPVQGAAQTTDFAELTGSGTFRNGVLKSDDLNAKNPLLRLTGSGEVDLVRETIDYLAQPTVVNTAGGQGGKELAGLSGLVVPIRIKGDLYRPKISIDWQSALRQKAVDELRDKLGVSEETVRGQREALREKAKKELDKALGEELSKSLQGLFGKKKPAPAPPPEPEPAPAPAPDAAPQ